ncbi:MAG TPA: DMT family transporter [Pseudomonas sp.]|nr:DMT family transporter [Pseudomonas sp.]
MSAPLPFPRLLAVAILICTSSSFAANHIAARIAFDHHTGLLLAILCRSGLTFLVLATLVLWRGEALRLSASTWRWQILLGLLIAMQSFGVYSAVARIPVAVALLVVNLAPILLALLSWALGGPRPSRRAALLMGIILFGLVLVLDIPTRLSAEASGDSQWGAGIAFGVMAAAVFAVALWITEHRLSSVPGTQRSMLTLAVVFVSAAAAGASGALPGSIDLPDARAGWIALGCLILLYGTAFSLLFICMPRLDIARNAPVMNVEPVASLLLGWLILDQALAGVQLLGGALVIGGIVLLALRRG